MAFSFEEWFEQKSRKTKISISLILILLTSFLGWNIGEILYWVGWNIGQMFYFIGITTSALFVIVIFLVMRYK